MLPQLRVASPCTADWEKMVGDDRVRYCDQCKLNVYNISAMSSSEIEQLLFTSTGRVCGRLYQRPDGTILTKDCPVGFSAKVRHVSRVAGAALAAMMSTVSSAASQNPPQSSSTVQTMEARAGINLTIVDPTGAVISKASIAITDSTDTLVMRGESDDLGSYQTSKLNSGSWKIRVSSPGFEPQEAIVTLGDREVLQSVMKLEIVTTMMGVIVSVYDDAFPAASEFPMPNYISSQRLPDTAPAPPKPSRNPISRLLSKLHF